MADNKIRLPSSEGGLVRYSDENNPGKFILKPETVIGICVAVIIFGIVLAAYGSKWFGY